MFCIHCGENNPDSAMFCPRCGMPLEKHEQLPFPNLPFSPTQSNMSDAPTFSGYLSGELQPPVPPAPYSSPYQQTYVNQQSGTLPNVQMPIPGQNIYAPTPIMAPQPRTPREPQVRIIARPLPLWAFIFSIVVVGAMLVALFFTGSDWAAGAMRVGIVSGVLAILILLATIVRTLAGMAARSNPKRRIQFISTGLLVVILLVTSGIGLTQQTALHQMQGRSLEGQQQWESAINEFQLAGEHAPNSDNIARTYDEWGEQLSNTQHYGSSIDKFNTVLDTFSAAPSEVIRAQSDNVTAYLNWGKQAEQQHDYSDAITHFSDLLNLSYCNTNCQAQANALDATANYNLAETQLAAQQYASAANTFQTLATLFPKSPEAQKDHEDFAKALFGQGKQQLTSACSSAIPIYQELASKFGDTPQGQQASAALKAPQDVKGRFTTAVPKSSALTPKAVLAQGLYANIPQGQFFQLIAGAPTVIIKSDGSFDFKAVKQGKYDLAWGTNNTDGSAFYYFSYRQSDKSLIYIANVGPLCPFDFGSIDEPIPSAP
ncbi:MAG TPA: tetratricopeptide repeat protein [Ktedonobacteraceae bacterium]|nr:tetratricopeptide repeat protein [Ktedonobacteraceae bacterium]